MRSPALPSATLSLILASTTTLAACHHDGDVRSAADAQPDSDEVVDDTPTGDTPTDPTLGPVPEGDTVARVEVGQYVGLWYEIASIPMGFQASCAATTATYGVIDATTVSVYNRCLVGGLDGDPIEIEGTATVVDEATNARLEVDFGFARSPYWIVDLAVPDGAAPYEWAIVSNPDRTALWILSRTPQITDARRDALLARLDARGYAPERLRFTEQPAQ
jgi:apolipoprotein D and lipocalin family protein